MNVENAAHRPWRLDELRRWTEHGVPVPDCPTPDSPSESSR
jgi:hypothetical protein